MMFRSVRFPASHEFQSLDQLSRAQLVELSRCLVEDCENVSGLPFDQIIEQTKILLAAPVECLR